MAYWIRQSAWLMVLAASIPVGCGPIKAPRLPEPVTAPTTDVLRVDLTAASDAAARYEVIVTFVNPNLFELPMTHASYVLTVAGHSYRADAVPNTTIPAQGQVNLTLPAVISAPGLSSLGQPYEVKGTVTMQPPGQLRNLFYEMGLPMPTADFTGQGTVTGTGGGVETATEKANASPAPAPGSE